MKNILITGGCGFIGSNFINYMTEKYQDINIYNIDILHYCASEDNVIKRDNYEFIKGDINDYNLIVYLLKIKNIDTIVHFAAQSHVDNSFLESLSYTRDNVLGTHTLLEAVRNTNMNILFIHISTDEVYGESQHYENAKNEQSILCPTNPYSASKAGAEMYVNSYINSFGLKAIITRGNNVFGPNQYPEKLIPKFIKALNNNEKLTIHGDGSALRSFIYVSDVCSAIEVIINKGIIGEIYNIGSDDENEVSVMDIAKKLVMLIKNDENYENYITYVKDRPFNDKRYFISNEKLKTLGWMQKVELNDGLKKLLK